MYIELARIATGDQLDGPGFESQCG